MLSFENIDFFWALLILIPLALLLVHVIKWKLTVKQELGSKHLIERLTKNYSSVKFRLKLVLLMLAIATGIIAAVNLRKELNVGDASVNSEQTQGIDVVIALDLSKSMWAQDVKPTRFDQAKLLISKLLQDIGNNRVGFVVFAGKAILQMPVTSDVGALNMLLSNVNPDVMPVQGTEIGAALLLSNEALGNTADKKHKAIILLSDGEDHDAQTNSAVRLLKESGVVVYTVGIGSAEGSPIFDPAMNDFVKDENGQTVISKLGEDALRNIAEKTNGAYFRLNDENNAAHKIAQQIDGMEKKLMKTPVSGAKTYLSSFPFLIWFMLLLLIIDILISERRRRKSL